MTPVGRGAYTLVGVTLFAVKHNLDRAVASAFFHRPWGPFNYLVPPDDMSVVALGGEQARLYATLLALALPFVAVGTWLTLRRLRDLGWPAALVLLFFVPIVNLAFFLLLALVPGAVGEAAPSSSRRPLDRVVPQSFVGSAAMAVLVTVVLGIAGTAVSVNALQRYGWGLFVGLPFALGLVSAVLHGYHAPRSLGACLGVASIAVVMVGVALLAFAVEGVFCIAMAAPLAGILALMGAVVGWAIQRSGRSSSQTPALTGALALFLPLMVGAEREAHPVAPLLEVRTVVDVNAPPAVVWQRVIAFTALPPPTERIFRLGIAYPVQATLTGRGVGAVRRCEFSTGAFIEPIDTWDEPRRLGFGVVSQPAPMQEWTPYRSIHPAHLEGYLASEHGEFLLEPLPGGRTRLTGTTSYRHHMWPAPYWQLWSDAIIHRIHLRVLQHVRRLAEADAARS